jgi:hypothetical protein
MGNTLLSAPPAAAESARKIAIKDIDKRIQEDDKYDDLRALFDIL